MSCKRANTSKEMVNEIQSHPIKLGLHVLDHQCLQEMKASIALFES